MGAQGHLTDAATRHQIHIQRLAGGNLKKVAKFLAKAISTAKERISAGLTTYGTKRYGSQIEALQSDLASIYSDMKHQAVLDLGDFAEYELEFSARMLGQVLKVGVQFNQPAVAMLRAAILAEPLELEARKGLQKISINGALDQFSTKKSAEIISEIQVGSAMGETSQQIQRRLTSLHQLQSDQASSLVRTMTNHVASTARAEQLKANNDILKGMRRVATLDSSTTLYCMSIDQTVIPLDDPRPPYHWGCRTTIIPVLKDEFARDIPGSTRPSLGPDGVTLVSSKMSYQEWLARQTAAFQRDILGPNRYALFSKGELTLDKFVDDNGKTLTLQQLREREPMAFERAGLSG